MTWWQIEIVIFTIALCLCAVIMFTAVALGYVVDRRTHRKDEIDRLFEGRH